MTIDTINPATGKLIKSYNEMSSEQVSQIIDLTHDAYESWSKTNFEHRKSLMLKAAEVLNINKVEYATLMSNEMGKPITQGLAEIDKCIWCCEHYANNAEIYLQDKQIKIESQKSYISYQPLGPVFAIMPWNFPFWQVFRFACPTLMAGNAGLLSHAPISTGTGQAIEEIFIKAGFPNNLFKSLIISNEVASDVIANKKVIAVTLTGSERAGSIVGAQAAKNLKKVVLELGGSDPYIICDDADLEHAANQILASRMNNSGQVCIAAKRVIASNNILPELQNKIIEGLKNYQMGEPRDPLCNFGPMARKDLRDEVHKQVRLTIEQGAKLILGGEIPAREGFYYPPTLLTDVKPGMEAFDREIFGPVVVLIEAKDLDDAIQLANNTEFGLGAAIFTKDIKLGEEIARDKLQAGACFVNGLVGSDPRLPFGGIKLSGYGRELSEEGIKEFVNTKTIVVKKY